MKPSMPFPRVSCIVPVFNGEKYLSETIESILGQTYSNIETIVIDDGSTDGTAEVLKQYTGRVRAFKQNHSGPSAARNLGIEKSSGELIAFLDADDLWAPEKIQQQVEHLQAHAELDVCFTQARNFWIPELEHEKKRLEEEGLVKFIHPFLVCTFLGRREIFDKVGMFKPELVIGEDSDFFCRMKDAGIQSGVISKNLVFRRLHESNLTRNMSLFTRVELQQRAAEALGRYRQKEAEASCSEQPGKAEGKPSSRKDADIFFEALSKVYTRARNSRAGAADFYYSIAGHTVKLCFAGPALISLMTPALEHLRVKTQERAELTIGLCDFDSNDVVMPEVPCTFKDYTARRKTTEFNDDEYLRADYQERAQKLHVLHAQKDEAFFFVKNSASVLQADQGAPLAKIFRWWMRKKGIQLVHGGVVGMNGTGILLAGKGGSGKSTTALTCLAGGMDYLSDDYCLVESKPVPAAYSLYCSGKVQSNNLDLVPGLSKLSSKGRPDQESGKTLFFVQELFPERITRQLLLKAILIPVIEARPQSELIGASAVAALQALAPSTLFQLPGSKNKDFYELVKIVESLPCYVFRVGSDPGEATRIIREFLTSQTPEAKNKA